MAKRKEKRKEPTLAELEKADVETAYWNRRCDNCDKERCEHATFIDAHTNQIVRVCPTFLWEGPDEKPE